MPYTPVCRVARKAGLPMDDDTLAALREQDFMPGGRLGAWALELQLW